MSPDADTLPRMPFRVLIALLLLGAVASFHQLSSRLFYCGVEGAHPEIFAWSTLAGLQGMLFLWAAWSARGERIYRVSQWIALGVCAYVLYQLSAVHARPLLLAALGVGGYALCACALDRQRNVETANWQRLLCEGVLFVLAVLVIQSALALPVLYSRGLLLSDRLFGSLFCMSLVAAFWIVRSCSREQGSRLVDAPPLFLLAMILLRAKQPDGAYDSLFYKGTVPVMLEDWRTALTGITDHTLLGTNLQEIINSQLRILDIGHEARVLSMLACLGLWVIVPAAARAIARLMPAGRGKAETALVINIAALLMVSLTEPLTASGTSYQEPLQILLLAAGLLAGPLGWIFLSAAAAVKATALVFIPLLLLVNLAARDRAGLLAWLQTPALSLRALLSVFNRRGRSGPVAAYVPASARRARVATLLCALLAVIVFGEQLIRNQLMAGRLLAPSDMLSRFTDPQNQMLGVAKAEGVFDTVKQRPAFDNVVGTIMHMSALDKWLPVEEHGFHAFPSSRLPLVAFALGLLALLCAARAAKRSWALLALAWMALFVVYLQLFSQGRHMAAASFAAVPVIVLALVHLGNRSWSQARLALVTLAVGLLAFGDQLTGNLINVGWDCMRRLSLPASPLRTNPPVSALDQRLAAIANTYLTRAAGLRDVVPTILCDSATGPKPYMGVHYAYSVVTHQLLARYLSADPARAGRLDRAVLALCVDAWHLSAIEQAQLVGFRSEGRLGDRHLFVSDYLSAGGSAVQLVPSGFRLPRVLRPYLPVQNLAAAWREAQLENETRQQTPTGRGVLEMDVEGALMPTLVAPNGLIFSEVKVLPGDRLFVEAGLPHKQSDGLALELRLGRPGAAPLIRKIMLKRGRLPGAAWQQFEVIVPDHLAGSVTLTVAASSEGGDPDADWVSFRWLLLERRVH